MGTHVSLYKGLLVVGAHVSLYKGLPVVGAHVLLCKGLPVVAAHVSLYKSLPVSLLLMISGSSSQLVRGEPSGVRRHKNGGVGPGGE